MIEFFRCVRQVEQEIAKAVRHTVEKGHQLSKYMTTATVLAAVCTEVFQGPERYPSETDQQRSKRSSLIYTEDRKESHVNSRIPPAFKRDNHRHLHELVLILEKHAERNSCSDKTYNRDEQ